MALERRRLVFSGHVQGVGFRATCQWLARGFEVLGYVRNLPDGRVELVAEGDPAEIDRFIEAIQTEKSGFIRETSTATEPIQEAQLDGFSIRY